MEADPLSIDGQAKWALVTDEVNLVATGGEFFPEGRGEDATAAYAGVAGDADFEWDEIGHDFLEAARGVTERSEGVNDEWICGPEWDSMGDAGT